MFNKYFTTQVNVFNEKLKLQFNKKEILVSKEKQRNVDHLPERTRGYLEFGNKHYTRCDIKEFKTVLLFDSIPTSASKLNVHSVYFHIFTKHFIIHTHSVFKWCKTVILLSFPKGKFICPLTVGYREQMIENIYLKL